MTEIQLSVGTVCLFFFELTLIFFFFFNQISPLDRKGICYTSSQFALILNRKGGWLLTFLNPTYRSGRWDPPGAGPGKKSAGGLGGAQGRLCWAGLSVSCVSGPRAPVCSREGMRGAWSRAESLLPFWGAWRMYMFGVLLGRVLASFCGKSILWTNWKRLCYWQGRTVFVISKISCNLQSILWSCTKMHYFLFFI